MKGIFQPIRGEHLNSGKFQTDFLHQQSPSIPVVTLYSIILFQMSACKSLIHWQSVHHPMKGSETLSIPKCPREIYIFGMWNNYPHPYTTLTCKDYLDRTLHLQLIKVVKIRTSQLRAQFLRYLVNQCPSSLQSCRPRREKFDPLMNASVAGEKTQCHI